MATAKVKATVKSVPAHGHTVGDWSSSQHGCAIRGRGDSYIDMPMDKRSLKAILTDDVAPTAGSTP
jgi:hypothetical protein